MLHRPLVLAALADAAVPGLLPVEVEGYAVRAGSPYQRVRVTGSDGREWTVQSALSTAAGAAVDQSRALARLLTERVPFGLPQPTGVASTPGGGTIAVYPRASGQPLEFADLQARSAPARSLGVSLAALHDLEPAVFEEAGVPSYDAEGYRTRRLAQLDRAAATGHIPAGLLARWERALEDVALWHFLTVPTHGTLDDGDVLLTDDEVVGIDGWHAAAVSDPAVDFAALFMAAAPDAVDTVIEAYAQARRERPDTQLERRIRLAAELRLMTDLMDASGAGDEAMVRRCTRALRRLDEQTQDDDSLIPPPPGRRGTPAAAVDADTDDLEPVDEDASTDDEETLDIPVGPHLGAGEDGAAGDEQDAALTGEDGAAGDEQDAALTGEAEPTHER